MSDILWSLRLHDKLPSANDLTRGKWAETNWRKRFERQLEPLRPSKRLNSLDARAYIRRPVPMVNAPKCSILVTRIMGPRERPYEGENVWAGMKPLIDAMVLAGYLPADSDSWLVREPPIQRKAENGEKPGIAVLIRKIG